MRNRDAMSQTLDGITMRFDLHPTAGWIEVEETENVAEALASPWFKLPEFLARHDASLRMLDENEWDELIERAVREAFDAEPSELRDVLAELRG